MSKLILFSILIAFSLIFPKILLVPEEFTTIQQAVVVAKNEDTVSVNFSRPKGHRMAISSQRIMGKKITFEVRGEGKDKLSDILKSTEYQPNTDNKNRVDSGWIRQQMVNRLDTVPDIQPHIAVDNLDQPWVIWIDKRDDTTHFEDLHYTKWNGNNWDEETGLFGYSETLHFVPKIIFDSQNHAWVVSDKQYLDNTTDIFFTRWIEGSWEPERIVNLPDSTEVDFGPKIAFGGGQIWCTWYGGISAYHKYKIYATRWNGEEWEPETQVSPPDTFDHWFCDIAVDSLGNPHVVWQSTYLSSGVVYYRTYDGVGWLAPETLNNPQIIRPDDWAVIAIAVDNIGNVHVGWDGIPTGGNQDIFYSKKENGRWLEPARIHASNIYSDAGAYIISKGPDDIWISWCRDMPGLEAYSYVSHFDGLSWSEEERLDDRSITYSNGPPQTVFRGDEVWGVWDAYTVGVDYRDIYYSRYLGLSVNERQKKTMSFSNFTISPNPFNNMTLFSYTKISEGLTFLGIYDLQGRLIRTLVKQQQAPGYYSVHWDGKDINFNQTPGGVYFALLRLGAREVIKKIIKKGGQNG
jgi:hypothetical protein